jgi:6-phosphofructokinase 1
MRVSDVFVVAQGGGPTAVINQTVAGAALEIRRRLPRAKVLGARYGVRGVRKGDYIDLSRLSEADLRRFGNTPNSGLGSTRDKPDETYCSEVIEQLRKAEARAFIYIGGNDTAGTMQILDAAGSGIAFLHAPKTVDNDLCENDHTPGFISAAWFVASAFLSLDLDFRAMPGIYLAIVMGRHAGFLTASGAAWRKNDGDGPHLVYVPERGFSIRQFLDDVGAVRERHGRCIIAMSEGVQTDEGRPLLETIRETLERDAHGNVQLSGGDLGVAIQGALTQAFPKVRVRVDTFGYLPRAFPGLVSEVDGREAFDVGRFAVAACLDGSCSVGQQYDGERTVLRRVPLGSVAGKTRLMPAEFLKTNASELSDQGMSYLRRLVPAAPDYLPPLL